MIMRRISFMLFAFFLFLVSGFSQKKVLLEKFTNVYCGTCPNATIKIEELQEKYPDLLVLKHFKPIDFDFNPMENDQSNQLWEEALVPYVPSGMVDRIYKDQSLTHSSSRWEDMIINQLEEKDVVDIGIGDLDYDSDSRTLQFSAELTFSEDLPSDVEYRLHAVMVEDTVYYRQKSYYNDTPGHPLEGLGEVIWSYVHKNVVRGVLDDAWGTQAGEEISQNEVITMPFTYVIPEERKAGRHSITLILTQHDDDLLSGRKVLDAAQFKLADIGVNFTSTVDYADNSKLLITGSNVVGETLEVDPIYASQPLSIYDMSGQLINVVESVGGLVDITNLPEGKYILVVNTPESKEAQLFFKL